MFQQIFNQEVLSHVSLWNKFSEVCKEITKTCRQDLPLRVLPKFPFTVEGIPWFPQFKVINKVVVNMQLTYGRITSAIVGHVDMNATKMQFDLVLSIAISPS